MDYFSGISLQYMEDQGVYVVCQSDKAIFVNSKNTNHVQSYDPGTVIKVPPNCNLQIFVKSNLIFTLNTMANPLALIRK